MHEETRDIQKSLLTDTEKRYVIDCYLDIIINMPVPMPLISHILVPCPLASQPYKKV